MHAIATSILAAGLLAMVSAPPAPGAQNRAASRRLRYTITDLGTLGGEESDARAINNRGQVVGVAETAGREYHAFLWAGGTIRDLGTLPGYGRSEAHAINERGQVVGVAQRVEHGAGARAFVWGGGRTRALQTPEGQDSDAYGINDRGQVVGSAGGRPCLWTGSRIRYLSAPASQDGGATGITGKGQIVGDLGGRAVLWNQGKVRRLGTLGGRRSAAAALNDRGEVVGSSATVDPASPGFLGMDAMDHAFLWRSGRMVDLGTLASAYSHATGVNASGSVVGYCASRGYQALRAFLYRDGRMQDLNRLLPGDSGWVLEIAYAINDRGQIVGSGKRGGRMRAFLMTPVATN